MQVTLGRKGDYSLRAMLAVARHHGHGRRKAREIAAEMDIPIHYLAQILANLVHEGLLVATAGPDGGYALAREPAAISLLDVMQAAEGPLAVDCCVLSGGPRDWQEVCPVHEAWVAAQETLAKLFGASTLADLVRNDDRIEAGAYRLPQPGPAHANMPERRGVRVPREAIEDRA
jgi:Rrf2 family protein